MTTSWTIGERTLDVGDRPLLMGVLNVTPDSFSDGDRFFDPDVALEQARSLIAAGADLIDVGGESTRPGAEEVPDDEQIRRVVPAIEAIAAESDVPVSVDTRSAVVARAAVRAGASVVNDVSALRHDRDMPSACAEMSCGVVLMHMRGTPHDMRARTEYDDVIGEVVAELREGMPFHNEVWRAYRTEGAKYTVKGNKFGARPWQFFDLKNDPGEQNNLLNDPDWAEEVARHHRLLAQTLIDTDDPFVLAPAMDCDGVNTASYHLMEDSERKLFSE